MAVHFFGHADPEALARMERELSGEVDLAEVNRSWADSPGSNGHRSNDRKNGRGEPKAMRHTRQGPTNGAGQKPKPRTHVSDGVKSAVASNGSLSSFGDLTIFTEAKARVEARENERMVKITEMELDVWYWRASRIDPATYEPATDKVRKEQSSLFHIPIQVTMHPELGCKCLIEGREGEQLCYTFPEEVLAEAEAAE